MRASKARSASKCRGGWKKSPSISAASCARAMNSRGLNAPITICASSRRKQCWRRHALWSGCRWKAMTTKSIWKKPAPFGRRKPFSTRPPQNRDRVKQLRAEKIAAQSELDTVEAAYAVALSRYQDALEEIRGRVALVLQRRAELNLSRKQLTDTVTTAPFDAIVHQRLANPGEFVQTGTPLAIIAAVNPLRLRLEIPERRINPGPSRPARAGDSRRKHQHSFSRDRARESHSRRNEPNACWWKQTCPRLPHCAPACSPRRKSS